MAYLGNDLQVAFPTYRNIDDISGSFNGVTTSFPLTVAGVAPIPAPINSQQCLISVNGVVQRPDDSGTEGFRLSGGNIIFASAPAGGVDFFGVILAGADYVNIGANFPSGTAVAPSITFDSDLDTGIYNPAGNQIGFTTSGVQRLVINSSGQISGGLGTAAAPVISFISDPNTGIYSPGADQVAISTGGSGRLFVDASGRVGVGSAPSVGNGIHATINTNNYGTALVLQNANVNGWAAEMQFLGITTTDTQAKIGALATGPGSNSGALAFYTANAGSYLERLRITSAGLVGIGTSTPAAIFSSKPSASSTTAATTFTGDGLFIDCANTTDGNGNYGGAISWSRSGSSTTRTAAITNVQTGSDADVQGLAFLTHSSGTSTNPLIEAMRITGAGLVGIGTTGPGHALDVVGDIRANPASGNSAIRLGRAGADRWAIYTDTSHNLNFYSDVANSLRATIDSSGRLLVGTSSSRQISGNTAQIQLEGTDTNNSAFSITTNSNNNQCGYLVFGKSRGTAIGGTTVVQADDFLGRIDFAGANGSNVTNIAALIAAQVDGAVSGGGVNDMPGRLVFSTTADGASSPTERMRITSAGYTFIGCTSQPGSTVAGLSLSPALSTSAHVSSAGSTTTSVTHFLFGNGNGGVGSIVTSGSATAYNTSSDYRLKENVTAVTDGITRLQQLKPSRFNFIADPSTVVDGFIAHEVQTIVPEAITGEKDAVDDEGNPVYQAIDQSKLVPLLTAALQEAITKIESLEARIAALEA